MLLVSTADLISLRGWDVSTSTRNWFPIRIFYASNLEIKENNTELTDSGSSHDAPPCCVRHSLRMWNRHASFNNSGSLLTDHECWVQGTRVLFQNSSTRLLQQLLRFTIHIIFRDFYHIFRKISPSFVDSYDDVHQGNWKLQLYPHQWKTVAFWMPVHTVYLIFCKLLNSFCVRNGEKRHCGRNYFLMCHNSCCNTQSTYRTVPMLVPNVVTSRPYSSPSFPAQFCIT